MTNDNIKTWPEKIYLTHKCSFAAGKDTIRVLDWTENRKMDDDIEYVRKDLVKEMK